MDLLCKPPLTFVLILSLAYLRIALVLPADRPLAAYVVRQPQSEQQRSTHSSKSLSGYKRAADGETIFISPGEAIELHCSVEGAQASYSVLEWLDGRVPIKSNNDEFFTVGKTLNQTIASTSSSRVLTKSTCRASLIIRNLTVNDYGNYHCRCVNDYTSSSFPLRHQFNTYFTSDHTEPFCSRKEYLIRLLPKEYQNKSQEVVREATVTEDDNTVDLDCNLQAKNDRTVEFDVVWTKVGQDGSTTQLPFHSFNGSIDTIRVTVRTAEDQAKFICHSLDNSTVYAVHYVSIKDYLQLSRKFIFPPSNTSDSENSVVTLTQEMFIDRGDARPLCAVFPSTKVAVVKDNITYHPHQFISTTVLAEWQDFEFTLEEYPDTKAQVKWILLRMYGSHKNEPLENILRKLNGMYTCVTEDVSWQPVHTRTVNLNLTAGAVEVADVPSSEVICMPPPSIHVPSPSSSMFSAQTHSTTKSIQLSASPLSTEILPTSNAKNQTNQPVESHDHQKVETSHIVLMALIPIVTIICLMICVFIALLYAKKRHHKHRRSVRVQMTNCKPTLSRLISRENPNVFLPGICFASPPFINEFDSGIHEQEFISRQMAALEFKEELGSGAFGVVRKAIAHNIEPEGLSTTVAVKSLKEIASGEDEKDIISELTVLQHVRSHPNVVSLLGAAAHKGNLYIIVEYCARGSLLQFLRDNRPEGNVRKPTLSPGLLISMLSQVASGMEYLVSKNCIHRDVAARNVLITDDFTLKVADFGLARKVYQSIYRPSGGRVPIKWMAPETILDQVYTTKSDIWSFGVLLWEVMTLGRSPYPGMAPQSIMTVLKNGYRMPKPDGCPDEIYAVMLKCWQFDATQRPNFTELISTLASLQEESLMLRLYGSQDLSLLDSIEQALKSPSSTSDESSRGYISDLRGHYPYITTTNTHQHDAYCHQSDLGLDECHHCHHSNVRPAWNQSLYRSRYLEVPSPNTQPYYNATSHGESVEEEDLCSTCQCLCEEDDQLLRWTSMLTLSEDITLDSVFVRYENCTSLKLNKHPGCLGQSQLSVCSNCKGVESTETCETTAVNEDHSLNEEVPEVSCSLGEITEMDTTDVGQLESLLTGMDRLIVKPRPAQLKLSHSENRSSNKLESRASGDSGMDSLTSENDHFFFDTTELPNRGYLSLVGGASLDYGEQ